MIYRIRNLLNLDPAYIWRRRYHDEQRRSFDAIRELRAAEAYFGDEWAIFHTLQRMQERVK